MKALLTALALTLLCTGAQAAVTGYEVEYTAGGEPLRGYLVFDDSLPGTRPGVLVVHEWWGQNRYARQRAHMLAAQGYVALALDMYGNGRNTDHPQQAAEFMNAILDDEAAMRRRFLAARDLLASHPSVDPKRIAAIGYCFGGGVVLGMARSGVELSGVISFHGGLATDTPARPGAIKTPIVVFNGEADPFVPEEQVDAFKAEMDAAGANYTYIGYPGAKHSFTNPHADAIAAEFGLPLKYDAAADRDSWNRALQFLDLQFWPPGSFVDTEPEGPLPEKLNRSRSP